jgi:hypothetical protein
VIVTVSPARTRSRRALSFALVSLTDAVRIRT